MSDTVTENLPVAFDAGPSVEVPVVPDSAALKRQKRAAKLAEARAYEQLGQRLLTFKAKKYGEVGDYIVEKLGVKKVGHGTIISVSENADEYIRRCDEIVQQLLARDPPCDVEVIVAMMQLVRDFNRQLLDSGVEHIRADRQPSLQPEDNNIKVPFPAGTPVMIGIGHAPQRQVPENAAPIEPATLKP